MVAVGGGGDGGGSGSGGDDSGVRYYSQDRKCNSLLQMGKVTACSSWIIHRAD